VPATPPQPSSEPSPASGPEAAFERATAALYERGPGRMVPDLDRITALASLLGDPQVAYPSVHVTGTNGKGSVVRMIGALCAAAGLSAGTYTSPHLQSVRERLSLAGRHISAARFAEVHDEVAPLAELLDAQAGEDGDRVTFFELLTAMAYWWFADAPVDVGVFEVGMGGRWDATNLVRGEVAVLSEIDVDHSELGDDPATVAREKVGIIKPGAHVVVGRQRPEALAVIDEAVRAAQATAWYLDVDLAVVDRRVAVGGQQLTLRVGDREVTDVVLPLFGAHQADNAALALGAFAALTGGSFDAMDDEVLRHGLGAVTVPGRLEVVHRDPTVVLDGAHNPHGARAAAAAVAEAFEFRDVVLVAACLEDKDVLGILGPWREVAAHVIVTAAPSPRAASLERMHTAAVEVFAGAGTPVEAADDLDVALELAERLAGEGDGVVVTGSLLTVGAARDRYLPVTDPGDEVVYEPDDLDGDDEATPLEALEEQHDRETFQDALDRVLDDG
jgi:dihydrofolate synthase / folylpolyglutamate synthase